MCGAYVLAGDRQAVCAPHYSIQALKNANAALSEHDLLIVVAQSIRQ